MSKRKLLLAALALCLVAVLAMGGTLAYLTDTDNKTNEFTFGNIDIELNEVFPEDELMPGENNALDKIVTVKNIGDNPAYMWIELWIPAELEDKNTPLDPSLNNLHFNPFDTYVDADGNEHVMRGAEAKKLGYTLKYETVEVALGSKMIGEGENAVKYNGYREYIKNDTPKAKDESTATLLARVFMDKRIDSCKDTECENGDDCLVLIDGTHYAGSWEIIVNAFGIQSEGFDNIEEAIAAYAEQDAQNVAVGNVSKK